MTSHHCPDITFAVSSLSRFANNPGKPHWMLMKRVIGYVKATREYGILYRPSKKPLQLEAMSDALFNSTDSGRSWLAHVIAINGAIWSWRSQVSKLIADSPPMAETLALLHTCALFSFSHFCFVSFPASLCTHHPSPLSLPFCFFLTLFTG